jgi:NDP-sugar pyrophosphorylase family protein
MNKIYYEIDIIYHDYLKSLTFLNLSSLMNIISIVGDTNKNISSKIVINILSITDYNHFQDFIIDINTAFEKIIESFLQFDDNNNAVSIEEKPTLPKSKFAVPGIYFYPNNVVELTRSLVPSTRGELEITDLNLLYQKSARLNCRILSRGTAWFDTGTVKSLNDASNFLRVIEERQGIKIGVPEEIAIRLGYMTKQELTEKLRTCPINEYRNYLMSLLEVDKIV